MVDHAVAAGTSQPVVVDYADLVDDSSIKVQSSADVAANDKS